MNNWWLCATALYSAPSLPYRLASCTILEYSRSNLTHCDKDKFVAWKYTGSVRDFSWIFVALYAVSPENSWLSMDFKAKSRNR